MKPLEKNYRKNSYDFSLVKRQDDVAVYEQREPLSNRIIGYEVFIVQKQEGGTKMFGSDKELEAKELTPGNEQWGYLGFTCATIDAANNKFDMLLARIASKPPVA